MKANSILYAEDQDNDVLFLELALKRANLPHVLTAVSDGAQALDYLAGAGVFADRVRYPFPALVLLDINMPKKSGFEVLEWIRKQAESKSLPVLILTSSDRPEDLEKARRLGADDYLVKPPTVSKLTELVRAVHARWLSENICALA